jgi:malto-oligosyltrehalose synthase/4-alpha-glucanotransferase
MYNPVSTYRIQFHKGFTFDDFERIIPYLENLGVRTIYASPIFSSVPGSMHGYDGIDPLQINPEIGNIDQLVTISKKLKEKNIGWVQDIVPNHMAYHPGNTWLMDVLENGPSSAYANFFDSSLTDDLLFKGRIMVPFLGSDLEEAIEKGELKIVRSGDKLVFSYAEQTWPLKAESYANIGEITAISDEKLLQIANEQYYRLCSYKETGHLINFRRFFTVNSLVCLNMQNDEVFNNFHQLIIQLVKDDIFQGLRIDHIDGLYDPSKYLARLRKAVGNETYIVVEKILEKDEHMPPWPIQGNTGYDFLALVNNLLTGSSNKHKLSSFYKSLVHNKEKVADQIIDKKSYILYNQMAGELDNLTHLFGEADVVKHGNVSKEDIKQAIAQFLIRCPDYRFYGNKFPLETEEKKQVKKLLAAVKKDNKNLRNAVKLIEAAFLYSDHNPKALHFYMRCMHFTGPLMAKGVEDTLMYTYNRFIGHNEVGDSPGAFSVSTIEFHHMMQQRQKLWPLSMNATATHDTKRGEDVRARLNVLPDMADEWLEAVSAWQQMNRDIKHIGAPDANDEYFIYQTLIGAYPMPGQDEDNFSSRLQEYLQKTMREGKTHSNWDEPNEEYERAVLTFAGKLLDKRRPFWKNFIALHEKIAEQGVVNSLTQTLLKFTCPGIPDVYQGCEHWDLSLVDPDNRRPVDYNSHDELLLNDTSLQSLWDNKFTGGIKIWITSLLLHQRRMNPLLFAEGDYIQLEVKGTYAEHILAFARVYKRIWFITVVPLNLAGASIKDWEYTFINTPADAPEHFENLVLNKSGKQKNQIQIKDIFEIVPFALLKLEYPNSDRGSGILMHVTSLPSNFGIGDIGPDARAFADVLHQTYQKYWQILPLNPVDSNFGYSPYSTCSSMAGNTMLLAPELLGWEGSFDVTEYILKSSDKADFEQADHLKQQIFNKAWENFKAHASKISRTEFNEFTQQESFWLNDHALYVSLKQKHENRPWYEWPAEIRSRNKKALQEFTGNNNDIIQKEKWLQWQFSRQWAKLKKYCNSLDIQLFGDLPFYVSYDSVDVWANPEIFSLDNDGNMQQVAGVPPDYFAKDGQLWGMPVYRWDKLKEQDYSWWVQRIRKNLERFDLLRLDHFRAFVSYWAVPAGEATAVKGKWERGPGADLFKLFKKEFGKLPFVAEDLGDIDEDVYLLRDEFELPGMRVLQFAFGGEAAFSPHMPQNYSINSVAYTGTHDNNTIKGWFHTEAGKKVKENLKIYMNSAVNEKKINEMFIRMTMCSVAKIAITPTQDILKFGENARMNAPGSVKRNWLWRLTTDNLENKLFKRLKRMTELYNRM